MKVNHKRILALLLALVMIMSTAFMASTTFATEDVEPGVEAEEVEDVGISPEAAFEALEETPAEEPEAEEEIPEEAVEEAAEEEPEAVYPAQQFTGTAAGVAVAVDAPEGALPEGTTMEVSEVSLDAVQNAVDRTADINGTVLAAVDITFRDVNGTVIEPLAQISVKMTSNEIAAAEDAVVVHIDADAEEIETKYVEAESVEADVELNTVSFNAADFTVYAVIEPGTGGDNARLTVNFINSHLGKGSDAANTVATVYVKNADDATMIDKIVYDPGIGETLPTGYLFRGWTIDAADANPDGNPYGANYTLDTKVYDIAGIKAYIGGLADANSIIEGEVLNIYAIILKTCTVTFVENKEEGVVTLGSHSAPMGLSANSAPAEYTVNMGYIPLASQKFSGWKIIEGAENIVSPAGKAIGDIIENGTTIQITGDVKFEPFVEDGAWLIFNENGKGGRYNAPQFVKAGEVTQRPRPDSQMDRLGYTFGGWYTDAACTTEFTFGKTLSENTTIYAKWIANTEANYTVICWTQSVDRTHYDLKDSQVFTNGTVGQNIPYTSVDNGDEDYATGVGTDKGHYTGFCLTEASKNQQIEITPEGDAVLNLYFDRIVYNFKFYLYRDATQSGRYDYANNSGSGSSLNDLVTWHSNQTEHPSVTGETIQSETVGGRTYYYFVMQAYYGEDISTKWPTYSKITGANGREAVSYVMMVGTALKPSATDQGSGTVKGIITVLNENILGATNNANGNYVVVRFPDSYYNWRYHIWFQAVDNDPTKVPDGKATYEYNGKLYYEDTVLVVRSSNTTDGNQNEPKYSGFDYQTRLGQNQQGVWGGGHWRTNADGTWNNNNGSYYHLNYIYDRQQYKIAYFDAIYTGVDGDSVHSDLLHESELIAFGADISEIGPSYNDPTPNASEKGYVFDGWYADAACEVPMVWTTMPEGSDNGAAAINVYAHWRQKQYRVFLHSCITSEEDPNEALSWGSENQAMNFRGDYMKTISLPTGLLDGYEFLGWYTDEDYNNYFDASIVPMSDDLQDLSDYDKAVDMTDEMDKYGNIVDPATAFNSDVNRFWITQKLDLYAKWKAVTEGALGIQVEYDANGGSNAPTDSSYYDDNTKAYAQAASTPPAAGEDGKELQFKCWNVMKWNGSEYVESGVTVLPGDNFVIHKADAKVEDIEGASASDAINKKYTIRLVAVYEPIDEPVPTYFDWYRNWSAEDTVEEGLLHQDENVQINKAYDIYTLTEGIPTRENYTFLGWARETEKETIDGACTAYHPVDKDDLYLKWVVEGEKGHYEAYDEEKAKWVTVTQVAADEFTPYQAFYAVWEIEKFYVFHSSDTSVETIGMDQVKDDGTYDIQSRLKEGYLYGGYYNGYCNLTTADFTDGVLNEGKTAVVYTGEKAYYTGLKSFWNKSKAGTTALKPEANTVYFLKEVPDVYLTSRIQYIYDWRENNKLNQIYLLTVIDDKNYTEVGFVLKGKAEIVSSFTFEQSTSGIQTTTKATDFTGVKRGFIGYLDGKFTTDEAGFIPPDTEFTMTPYWITPDNVTISGTARTFTTGADGTKETLAEVKP